MISIIHYISAKRRLKEADKTIRMLGVNACPPMMLAQRDMIFHEVEYYREEVEKLAKVTIFFSVGVLLYYILSFFMEIS
jgi:hypothetical protein